MKSRKIPLFLIFLLFAAFRLWGISFSGLNLSNDDRLLFRAEFESQRTIFVSRLTDLSLQQLTAFPEKLELVNNERTILALSRFGAVRIPVSGGLPSPVLGFPSFAEGNIPLKGRAQAFAASSDGRWILYIEPTSPAYGNMMLIESSSGAKLTVCEKIELPAEDFPARWSPDSRIFVYSKGGGLFYFPIIQDLSEIVDERFRHIGPGGITSVLWGGHGDFYYFLANTLYRVINPELFTRTIYGDFLSVGAVAAAFPFDFDSGFDRYWIAPDSGSILISKRGKTLFHFSLGDNKNNISILPHVTLPQGAGSLNVLWPSSGTLTVVSSMQNKTAGWRFEINSGSIGALAPGNIPSSSNGVLSPDGTRVVFWGRNGLEIWDYANWRLIQRLGNEPVFSCAWINNSEFISGGGRFIEGIAVSGQNITRRRICLSGADEFGFEEGDNNSSRIVIRVGNEWFASNGRTAWTPVNAPKLRNVSLSSQRYRVFLETQSSGVFKNIPMIRNAASTGTVSLVSGHRANGAYAQGRQIPVALCFDLYDDDTGLPQVLDALRRFNIKATFFMNGDFIRRNPLAAAAIIEAGHEAASLFYAPIDLSHSRYLVSREFIAQGLARNEDEFFTVTGKELSLFWHPPFHRSSAAISAAAAAAGYITVTRDIDPGDWMSGDDLLRLGIRRTSASDMIEQITEKRKSGAVIPVRLGLLPGGRDEYLFRRIDVLLDALVRSGCEIVPVSAAGR